MANPFEDVKSFLNSDSLPSYAEIVELTQKVSDILEEENTDYRQVSETGTPGSLLDFQDSTLPVIIVPDLHARPQFLLNILSYSINGSEVFDLLCQNKIRIICVGDALHSEKSTRLRWAAAETEMKQEIFTGPAMLGEMKDGLALLCGVMKLKTLFPSNFHFLKGNHENILNRTGHGDFSFRKYADEGQMVMEFIRHYYGDDVLYLIHYAEEALPLVAVCKGCVISHAEPKSIYTKTQLINARSDKSVVEGLTWTDNDAAEIGSVAGIIQELVREEDKSNYLYFGGHRPVQANYKLRQSGLYVQIHNPSKQNIVIITGEKKFNPDEDIINVAID